MYTDRDVSVIINKIIENLTIDFGLDENLVELSVQQAFNELQIRPKRRHLKLVGGKDED